MKAKSQLGKGMAALLKSNPKVDLTDGSAEKTDNQTPLFLDIQNITPNREQPRRIFKEEDLKELAASIKENGVIQPILVSKLENGKFEIIAGERRYRASKMIGMGKIPAIIKNVTKKDSMVMAIIENIQRSDLNCVEEALAYYQLMTEFNLTQEEVAKKLGKERSSIANYLRLLKLPKEVLGYLQKEMLSMGHAKVLASIKDESRLKELAKMAVEDSISVRELEKLAKKKNSPIRKTKTVDVSKEYESLKNKLERETGFHMKIKAKKNGAGEIAIKFTNDKEFNTIYEYFMK